jgi:hypothetical protein
VDVVELLTRRGGVATRAELIRATSRREVDAALAGGIVVALARGRYALPHADDAVAAAHALSGVVCLLSAALAHGWAVKLPPELPQVSLPPNRKVDPRRVGKVDVHRFRLGADDVADAVTSQDRTLLDCLRLLPFDEALAVVDSALRDGYSVPRLRALVRDARGQNAVRMRQIVEVASAEAANPFESVLRAIGLGVAGLDLKPQVTLHRQDGTIIGGGTFLGRPDLVDEQLRIVVEADSFEWHGERAALRADARRYNAFVVNGWLVLRFCWEDVMFYPSSVADVLMAAVAERTALLCPGCRRAS